MKFLSSDNIIFDVSENVAKYSEVWKDMVEICNGDDEEVIPISNIDSSILSWIMEWLQHQEVIEEEEEEDTKERRTDNISEWDIAFIKRSTNNLKDLQTLFDILVAGGYLDIKKLRKVCIKTIANIIKGKNPQEIRNTFTI